MIERVDIDDHSYEIEFHDFTITFWRVNSETKHSIIVKDMDADLVYTSENKGPDWSFDLKKVKSAIRLLESKHLFDKVAPVDEINKLLSDNAHYVNVDQIIASLIADAGIIPSDPQWAGNRVLKKLFDERYDLGKRLGYFL